MNNMNARRLLMLCGLALATVPLVSAQTWINEDFSGSLDFTNDWGRLGSGGSPSPSTADGVLTTTQTSTASDNRSLIWTKASDYNFYTDPITMTAELSDLSGAGDTGTVHRYLMISSTDDTNNGYQSGDNGVWLSALNTGGQEYLEVGTRRSGVNNVDRQTYSGTLTSMSLTLDGGNYTVNTTGITGDGSSFSGTLNGLGSLVESDFDGDFQFNMGVANQEDVSTAPSAEWNSVTVIPEPGTLGLVAIAMGVLALSHRKRKGARQN